MQNQLTDCKQSTMIEASSPSRVAEAKPDKTSIEDEFEKRTRCLGSPYKRPQRGERRSSSAPERRRILSRSSSSGNDKLNAVKKSPEASCSGQNKQTKSPKSSAWKTSKFFSRTLSSGELLRSLKKLSISSSGDESECRNDAKLFRNRVSRKKVTSEETALSLEAKTLTVTECDKRNPVQKEGIVCKKEDLMHLISEATKRKPNSSPLSRKVPLRQTRSASYESPRQTRRSRVRVQRSGSEECRSKTNLFSDEEDVKPPVEVEVEVKEKMEKEPQQREEPIVTQQEEQNEENNVEDDKEEECVSTVQWDEGAYIDAVLIGDAIESFLKGSMISCEKRVSFMKS